MPRINCNINLMLGWSANCVICKVDRARRFGVTDTKPFVSVVALSFQNSVKLLEQLKLGFNWNKYQLTPKIIPQNWYLNYLIDPSFQRVKKILNYCLKMTMVEQFTQGIIFQ